MCSYGLSAGEENDAEGVWLCAQRAGGHLCGDLEVASEPGHRIVAALEDACQPGKLGVEVIPPGGGHDRPREQPLVVVYAPFESSLAVAIGFVGELESVAAGDFAGERYEL